MGVETPSNSPLPHIAVVGCGGLGGPIALALSSSVPCHLSLFDPDTVELSNLHRQVQFKMSDIGKPKARALGNLLRDRGHPSERIHSHDVGFGSDTAHAVSNVDLYVDGSDSLPTKFFVNDHAKRGKRPSVIAAISGYVGHVFEIDKNGGCYRCLFEEPPTEDINTCTDHGVLGPAVAIVAARAASSAINLLDRNELSEVKGRVFNFRDLRKSFEANQAEFSRRRDCDACRS